MINVPSEPTIEASDIVGGSSSIAPQPEILKAVMFDGISRKNPEYHVN